MNRPTAIRCFGFLLFACAVASTAALAQRDSEDSESNRRLPELSGVVVEAVVEGFAAHKAGLQAGDTLLRWQRAASPPANPEPADGAIDSPFDLVEVEMEQAPRGALTLSGTREGRRLLVSLSPGKWKVEARPRLAESELELYQRAQALIVEGELAQGLSLWRRMVSGDGEGGDPYKAVWLLLALAKTAGASGDWATVERAFEDAQRRAMAIADSSLLAIVMDANARSFEDRSELDRAFTAYQDVFEFRRHLSSQSLGIAKSLLDLGIVSWLRGDLAPAEDFFQRSLEIRRALAPGGLDVAASLNNLGLVAWNRSDLSAATDYFREALTIQEKLDPQGIGFAAALNNLGLVAWDRGDFATAASHLRGAVDIKERLVPDSLDLALSLHNLGSVSWGRGDLAGADFFHHRAVSIQEKLAPNGLAITESLNSLGFTARNRGEFAAAETYYRRALAILEQAAPRSLGVTRSLNNLGEVSLDLRDFARAEQYLRRALVIGEEIAPWSGVTADTRFLLGERALARADLRDARVQYERALAIRRKRARGSSDEAECCHRLATVHRRRGQNDQAVAFYTCAVDALDAQKGRLGGSDENRLGYGDRHADIYRDAIDFFVEIGNPEEAFFLLERFRARELVALLAARDLVFSSDLPEELERRRRATNRDYDRAFEGSMSLSVDAGLEEENRAREELAQVRRRQDEIRAEIRAASPRLANLQDPQPLNLEATQGVLDPGTLLLSFSIGAERSLLFAVGPEPGEMQVYSLSIDEAALREEVERFRELLRRGSVDPRPERILLRARRLSDQLLAPATTQIGRAERLLIVADGPLHSLPFAALSAPDAKVNHRFLIESIPVYVAASATVFSMLKKTRRPGGTVRLAAFGDPQYSASALRAEDSASRLRAASSKGFALTPLPATRGEVESLQSLFPEASQIYLGAQATEARAKAVGEKITHLHIASHGLLNDRFPLDSAIAFTAPQASWESDDNGLLQAWEIFEQVRIDADLVTLSACETGLGKVFGGEGLLGLVRAFHYAGARSVLASLWTVSDTSTGELMKRFYAYLKAGQSKVDALRSAQLDLLRGTSFPHPFHWAGFALAGDWR